MSEAKASCFNGSHGFSPAPASAQDLYVGGSVAAGKLYLAAGAVALSLPLGFGSGTVDVTLRSAQIRGTLAASTASGTTITDGAIAGAISKAEIDGRLVPALATMMDNMLKDPAVSSSVKAQVTSIFDTDKDGAISAQEVAANGLVQLMLAPDLDLDGDGVQDALSLGLGLEAVGAVISAP